jgi:hypothetical protein
MSLLEYILIVPLAGGILLALIGHRPSGGWLNVAVSALTLALSLRCRRAATTPTWTTAPVSWRRCCGEVTRGGGRVCLALRGAARLLPSPLSRCPSSPLRRRSPSMM